MKKQYRDSNYVYLSVRLSACEDKGITSELIKHVADAKDKAAAEQILRDFFGDTGDTPLETLFTKYLTDAFAFADELIRGTPDLFVKPYEVIYPFRYAYDAQNLKSAIKCDALGKHEKAPEMFVGCGTVPADKVLNAVLTRDFSVFPPSMAASAKDAIDELSASHDPQCVDRHIDAAAFADMRRTADETGIPFLSELMRVRTDCVNVKTALRCMARGIGKATLGTLLLDGGTLDRSFFLDNHAANTDKLLAALSYTDYAEAAADGDIDRFYTDKAVSVRRLAFGIERILGYVVGVEAGIRDLRTAFALKKAGRTPEEIRNACRVR